MLATIGTILVTIGTFICAGLILVAGTCLMLIQQGAILVQQLTPHIIHCFNWVLTIVAA